MKNIVFLAFAVLTMNTVQCMDRFGQQHGTIIKPTQVFKKNAAPKLSPTQEEEFHKEKAKADLLLLMATLTKNQIITRKEKNKCLQQICPLAVKPLSTETIQFIRKYHQYCKFYPALLPTRTSEILAAEKPVTISPAPVLQTSPKSVFKPLTQPPSAQS